MVGKTWLMGSTLAIAVLLAACASPMALPPPPSIPPTPSVPPPPDPGPAVALARVAGQVLDRAGRPIPHAFVLVRSADARCRPMGPEVGAVTDESGAYSAEARSESMADFHGCVLVEARSGGASGSSASEAEFSTSPSHTTVDVRLESAPPLTAAEAERLVSHFAAAINDPALAHADLGAYVLHGPEALRVALDQYRKLLGRVEIIRPRVVEPHDPRRFRYELQGREGRTASVDVYQEELIRMHAPLLDYGFRSERFVNAYIRSISSGDAESLARLLSPDDIDFPVERAREMIVGYRQRYRDTATIRAEFVDLHEDRAVIIWRLRGIGPQGDEVTELLELGFGDGLIGVRGLDE